MVASTIYGEARGCSYEEQRLVAWCICNRVDSGYWGDHISDIITKNQFHGYDPDWEKNDYFVSIALEVLLEWSVGREADTLLPYATTSGYLYFYGEDGHNWFREEY